MNTWQNYYERRDRDASWVKWPDEQVIRFVYRARAALVGQEHGAMRALDMGCGSGRHMLFMANQGFEVWGIDYSEKAVEITNKQLEELGLPLNASMSALSPLAYDDDFFNIIVCWHTLYCNTLPDMRAALTEMNRVLAPGGRACVSLRRDTDYTCGKGEKIEENTYKLDPAQVNEDPGDMTVHYSSLNEAKELFKNFSNVEIGFSDFAFGNLDEVRAHWIVVVEK